MSQGALNNSIPCSADADCPASLVCYGQDASWVPSDVTYCLCSTWYGWELENDSSNTKCKLSPYAITVITFFAITSFYYAYELVLVSKDLYTLYKDPNRAGKFSLGQTIIYCFFWLTTGIIRMICLCFEFGSPEIATLLYYGPDWKYSPIGVYQTKPLLVATSIWVMLVDYNIVIVIYFIARKSLRLKVKDQLEMPTKYFSHVIQITYTIAGFVLILKDSLSLFSFFTIPFTAIAILGYILTAWRVWQAMNSSSLVDLRHRIVKLCGILSILLMLTIAMMFVLGYYNTIYKDVGFLPAGSFAIGIFLQTCQLFFITRFLRVSLNLNVDTKETNKKSARITENHANYENAVSSSITNAARNSITPQNTMVTFNN